MNYDEVMTRRKKVISMPARPFAPDVLDQVSKNYYKKNSRSAELFEKFKEVIPGGLEHNLGLSKPFPLTLDRAIGYHAWDADGNQYVDYLMMGGPILLGHHFAPLDEKISQLIDSKGPGTGLSCEMELLAAEKIIQHMPGVEMVRFLQSGTEADMAAIRLARTFTGKKKIIKFKGGYHGWSDQINIDGNYPLACLGNTVGIPDECLHNTLVVPHNDLDALARTFEDQKYDGGVAGVIAEATGGQGGTFLAQPGWLKGVRELCDRYGALLILDEVITGFRFGLGGAQAYYDVIPDLTVLGKIIAHGYPSAGALTGKKEIMRHCHPAGKVGEKAFMGGTLGGNPITTTACYYALQFMEEYGAAEKASTYAGELVSCLNDLFLTRPDLPFFAHNICSIVHVETTCPYAVPGEGPDELKEMEVRAGIARQYQLSLQLDGIVQLADSKRLYVCMAHDRSALDQTLKAYEKLLSRIPLQ